MQSAGVGLVSFFQTIANSEKNPERKKQFQYLIENLKKGRPLAQTLRHTSLLPVYDIPLIESGEKSGTLTRVCDILAKNYQISADSVKSVRAGMTKPLFTFAAALFIPSFPDLFLEKITLRQYLTHSLGTLTVVVLIAIGLYRLFMASYFNIEAARLRHKILLHIPFVRTIAQRMVQEKFCSSLAIMLEAGLPLYDAISLAGQTSAEPEILSASQRIIRLSKAGTPLPKAFQMEAIFSDDIKNSITLGIESGKVPTFLERSAKNLKKDIDAGIDKITKAIPHIVYWAVVLYVAWTIIGFYIVRMATLNEAINGGE